MGDFLTFLWLTILTFWMFYQREERHGLPEENNETREKDIVFGKGKDDIPF